MLLRVLLLLLIALPAFAQSPAPGWISDPRTGCKVWHHNPQPGDNISWSGTCPRGMAQGRGTLQLYKDGKATHSFEGEFRDGKPNGRGVWRAANGDRYEGEYRDGKLTGRVVYIYANGDRYEGDLRDSKPDGRGAFTYANGARYEGEYRHGKPNGFGTFTKGDSVFSGTWTNGCFKQGNWGMGIGASKADCGF